MLGQAFLPEEADSSHDAAAEQDRHRHAQEAGGDSSQVYSQDRNRYSRREAETAELLKTRE